MLGLLLCAQLTSLYTTPVADSYLWWGDESQQLVEARTQITTGVNRDPYALASSIGIANGFVRGNVWATALIYGLPQAMLSDAASPVAIGRTETALLSLLLVAALYMLLRRDGVSRASSILLVLLLASSRSFFLTSHSGRYDILTALVILLGFHAILRRLSGTNREATPTSDRGAGMRSAIVAGAAVVGMSTISIHTLTILGPAALVAAPVLFKGVRRIAGFAVGAAAMLTILLTAHIASTGTLSVLGTMGQKSTFVNVAEERPIIRPFSRSVQTANVVQRYKQVSTLAPWFLFFAIGTGAMLFFTRGKRHAERAESTRMENILMAVVILSWLLLEGSAATSYLIYVLPTTAYWLGRKYADVGITAPLHPMLALVLGCAMAGIGIHDALRARTLGDTLTRNNTRTLEEAKLAILESSASAPLVLGLNPAQNWLKSTPGIRGMISHFYEMPVSDRNVAEVLNHEEVDYVISYTSSWKPEYMREVQPIANAADSLGSLVLERVGAFTDVGRDYFAADHGGSIIDTVKVFQISTR